MWNAAASSLSKEAIILGVFHFLIIEGHTWIITQPPYIHNFCRSKIAIINRALLYHKKSVFWKMKLRSGFYFTKNQKSSIQILNCKDFWNFLDPPNFKLICSFSYSGFICLWHCNKSQIRNFSKLLLYKLGFSRNLIRRYCV